ncbi:MAG TPA: HIT family protein [Cytophagales bacterium]|jgi:histidine triad (HIT) family protein|nr:HIT family protein [Cytophagales bacterium]
MSSIFTKIINRDIPAHIVAEDDQHIAFLDINPLVEGHLLVVPKAEVDYLFDLEDQAYTKLQLFAKRVAVAQKKAIPCIRIGTAVVGLEVPHTHIHLVPLNSMDDINFSRPKLNPSKNELESTAKKIAKEYEQITGEE